MSRWPLEVSIPWSAVVPVNQRLTVNRGRIHTTNRWKQALNHARGLVMVESAGIRPDPEKRFRARLDVYLPDRRRRDLDALLKLPLDALEGWVVEDDSQVREMSVTDAGLDRESPRIEVTVEPLESADSEAA